MRTPNLHGQIPRDCIGTVRGAPLGGSTRRVAEESAAQKVQSSRSGIRAHHHTDTSALLLSTEVLIPNALGKRLGEFKYQYVLIIR